MGGCVGKKRLRVPAVVAESSLETPVFSLAGRTFVAKCVKVYDGDTIHIVIEYPAGFAHRFVGRMEGYNSAELRTKDAAERVAGERARDALSERILSQIVTIHCGKWDKYGRLLITVYIGDENINEWMVASGNGAPYTGRGEKKW